MGCAGGGGGDAAAAGAGAGAGGGGALSPDEHAANTAATVRETMTPDVRLFMAFDPLGVAKLLPRWGERLHWYQFFPLCARLQPI